MASKKKYRLKMDLGKTRKTKMDYFMCLIMFAVVIQLIILFYRLFMLTEL